MKLQRHFRNWRASRWKRRFGLIDDTIKQLQTHVMLSPKRATNWETRPREKFFKNTKKELQASSASKGAQTASWIIDRDHYHIEDLPMPEQGLLDSPERSPWIMNSHELKSPKARPLSAALLRTVSTKKRPLSACARRPF